MEQFFQVDSRRSSGLQAHDDVGFYPLRCFASFSVAILKMTHKMSSCILCLRAGSDSTSLCFVVLVLCLFCVLFVWFALSVVWFSMGPLNGLCIGPLPVLG